MTKASNEDISSDFELTYLIDALNKNPEYLSGIMDGAAKANDGKWFTGALTAGKAYLRIPVEVRNLAWSIKKKYGGKILGKEKSQNNFVANLIEHGLLVSLAKKESPIINAILNSLADKKHPHYKLIKDQIPKELADFTPEELKQYFNLIMEIAESVNEDDLRAFSKALATKFRATDEATSKGSEVELANILIHCLGQDNTNKHLINLINQFALTLKTNKKLAATCKETMDKLGINVSAIDAGAQVGAELISTIADNSEALRKLAEAAIKNETADVKDLFQIAKAPLRIALGHEDLIIEFIKNNKETMKTFLNAPSDPNSPSSAKANIKSLALLSSIDLDGLPLNKTILQNKALHQVLMDIYLENATDKQKEDAAKSLETFHLMMSDNDLGERLIQSVNSLFRQSDSISKSLENFMDAVDLISQKSDKAEKISANLMVAFNGGIEVAETINLAELAIFKSQETLAKALEIYLIGSNKDKDIRAKAEKDAKGFSTLIIDLVQEGSLYNNIIAAAKGVIKNNQEEVVDLVKILNRNYNKENEVEKASHQEVVMIKAVNLLSKSGLSSATLLQDKYPEAVKELTKNNFALKDIFTLLKNKDVCDELNKDLIKHKGELIPVINTALKSVKLNGYIDAEFVIKLATKANNPKGIAALERLMKSLEGSNYFMVAWDALNVLAVSKSRLLVLKQLAFGAGKESPKNEQIAPKFAVVSEQPPLPIATIVVEEVPVVSAISIKPHIAVTQKPGLLSKMKEAISRFRKHKVEAGDKKTHKAPHQRKPKETMNKKQ